MKKAMKKSDEPNEIALKVARLYVELELQALSIPFFNIASHMVPYHTPRMEPEEEEKEARKLERMGKGERDTANRRHAIATPGQLFASLLATVGRSSQK